MLIPEQLWNNLKANTLAGVVQLLESSEKLLANKGNPAICAGLYTYAVEEVLLVEMLISMKQNSSDPVHISSNLKLQLKNFPMNAKI